MLEDRLDMQNVIPASHPVLILGRATVFAHLHDLGIESGDDFDQIGLGSHDSVDIFVDAGSFVGTSR